MNVILEMKRIGNDPVGNNKCHVVQAGVRIKNLNGPHTNIRRWLASFKGPFPGYGKAGGKAFEGNRVTCQDYRFACLKCGSEVAEFSGQFGSACIVRIEPVFQLP